MSHPMASSSLRLPEQRRKLRLKSRRDTLRVEIAEKREALRQTQTELATLKPAKPRGA